MFLLLLLLRFCFNVEASCDRGLTQLRHRDSMALMRCVPTIQGQPDPCIVLTGGRVAFCQLDGFEYVCCGTTELLIELLTGRSSSRVLLTEQWRYYPQNAHFDYQVVVDSSSQSETTSPQMVITTPQPQMHPISYKKQATMRPSNPILSHILSTPTTMVTLLSAASYQPGNFTNSVRLNTNVVLIRDGSCTIVVNTGLPFQKSDIITNLAALGISSRDVQFLVITSAHPQFIGNINIFMAAQTLVENHFVVKDHVILGGVDEDIQMDMCSQLTYLLATPGPTENSVTVIVKNVPSMGTVAIVGSLFMHDDSITRVDDDYTWDVSKLIKSRRKVICEADWIVPAHSTPFMVTNNLRRLAQCEVW